MASYRDGQSLPSLGTTIAGRGVATVTSTDTARPSHVRYLIIAMVFAVTTLNNADRSTLSLAGAALQGDMGISSITLGYLFSSFAWAYMLAQIPGGWLMDRFGSKRVYAASIFVWSLMTFLQGFVTYLSLPAALVALFVLRISVGLAEGPSYPGNSRIVSSWFPAAERGTAAAIFNSAQYFATVAFAPLMGWIVQSLGWPYVFSVMGSIGMVLAGIWMIVIHAPGDHPLINRAEFDYIKAGGALVDIDNRQPVTAAVKVPVWSVIRQLLSSRMMLGIYAGQYCITTLVYFFLTWFPVYLVKGLHMPIMQAGAVAAVPAVCGFLGGILGGVSSDALLRRGRSVTFARKLPIVIGLFLSMSVVLCNWAPGPAIVILIMGLAYFGKGLGSLGWAVVADTSPKEAAALSGALFNTFANLAGITTPVVIGYIVERTGSFDGALMFVAANALGAILCFLLIVGRIERIQLRLPQ
jgi:ACS family glucarate transporter-like MFS transporter